MRCVLALLVLAGTAAPVIADPAEPAPSVYIDLLPVVISVLPDSGRFVQLYADYPIAERWSAVAIVVAGYADHASIPNSQDTYDLLGSGFGAGARFYAWNPFATDHAGFFIQLDLHGGPIRFREHASTMTASSGLAALVATWPLAGFQLRRGRFAGYIALGPDVSILPIHAAQGTFSSAMKDMFKLDGGVKPTAEVALGMRF